MSIADRLLPRTGHPALDDGLREGLRRVGASLVERLNPEFQQIAGTVWEVVSAQITPPVGAAHNPVQRPLAGDKARFVRELLGIDGGLLMVVGRRGSGKTAFCLMLAQEYGGRGRPVFVVGMPQRVLSGFGFREAQPPDLAKLPNKAVLVLDDVALFYGNREYARAGLLHRAIIESRHRDQVIIANAHNTALVDKYLLEATCLFLKPSSGMNDDLHRSGIRKLAQRSDAAFRNVSREQRRALVYCCSDELDYEGMLAYTPPRGWSQAVSKHHARP